MLDPGSCWPVSPGRPTATRERPARLAPPWGIDAQAAYEASLRLALGRGEHQHRPERFALVLTTLHPGVAWLLNHTGVHRGALLDDLAQTFPPPRSNGLVLIARRHRRRSLHRGIVRRYQHLTGRTPVDAAAISGLIAH